MKKYIFIALLSVLTNNIFGQTQDSLLRRQLELQRDFNPTLLDANKITSLPELPKASVQKPNTNYSTWAGRTTPSLEIALPKPSNIMTDIPYSTKRGYVKLNAGNYANIYGTLGYRIVDTEKNRLGFSFRHISSNGNVNYVQTVEPKSNKLFFMDNFAKLNYEYQPEAFEMKLHASYLHSQFNYYGNTFGEPRFFGNKKQRVGVFNVHAALRSKNTENINYKGYLDFKNFSTKFGGTIEEEGIAGNQLDALFGLAKPFLGGDSKIGIDGQFFGTFYKQNIKNYHLLRGTPYVSFEDLNWRVQLGVDLLFQLANKTRIRVAPNANMFLRVSDYASLYANIKGGFHHNTYLQMLDESRYINPTLAAATLPAYVPIDVEAGVKIGEISGFRFDIFGGYKHTNNEHFLILDCLAPTDEADYVSFWSVQEDLIPIYANLTHSHIGGMIQSNIWAPLDISVGLKKNFYTIREPMFGVINADNPKAYNKPGFETDVRATLRLIDNFSFMLNYYLLGDRWTYFNRENVKMKDIHDLGLEAIYKINDSFSLNVRANNVLAQKYDILYGHPAQGFSVLGGFTFKF